MLNRVMIIGNLGSDPEIKYTQSGTAVASLNVATSRKWKDGNGNLQEETTWHKIVAWAGTADYCGNFLTKGNKVFVEGRLTTRKWQDKDGNDRYTTEIVASQIQGLSPRNSDGSGNEGRQQKPPKNGHSNTGEEVPF